MIRLFRLLRLKREQSKALRQRKAARSVKRSAALQGQSTQIHNRYLQCRAMFREQA